MLLTPRGTMQRPIRPPLHGLLFTVLLGLGLGGLAVPSLGAQVVVEGEVVDEATGIPVQGVIVQFPDLGMATLTDELGYFRFDAVPRGEQLLSTYHLGYARLHGMAPIVEGDVLMVQLAPKPIPVAGVDVDVGNDDAEEIRRTGRGSDLIDGEELERAARGTNRILEVMRQKAPPRLNIQQGGAGGVGVNFCIQTSRMRPSVQELRDIGNACVPALLVLDGVIVYAPPKNSGFRRMFSPSLPNDVANMLLRQDPDQIESIRVLTGSDAFFRYGEDGRLGAVEIKTRRPERMPGG